MVNVGSVGQPRDGDNRACYVILDDGMRLTRLRPVAMRRTGRPTGRSRKITLSPAALRLRDHDPEDLRHSRARAVPGRPAPPGPLDTESTQLDGRHRQRCAPPSVNPPLCPCIATTPRYFRPR